MNELFCPYMLLRWVAFLVLEGIGIATKQHPNSRCPLNFRIIKQRQLYSVENLHVSESTIEFANVAADCPNTSCVFHASVSVFVLPRRRKPTIPTTWEANEKRAAINVRDWFNQLFFNFHKQLTCAKQWIISRFPNKTELVKTGGRLVCLRTSLFICQRVQFRIIQKLWTIILVAGEV